MSREHIADAGPDAQHAVRRVRRRRRGWPFLVLLALVVGWVAWLSVDAIQVRGELTEASALVSTLQEQVLAGDRAGATETLSALQVHARSARDATRGVNWSAAAVLPWVGPNVDAVRVIADVVNTLAATALPELMDATLVVDPAALAPVDGRVDLSALRAAAPTVVGADAAVREALERLEAVDEDALVSMIADPLARVRGEVARVAETTGTASRAVQLLPAMLGADGPRDYLLLVQNNAEVRATGGIPGTVILLRAEDGGVQVVEVRSGGSLGDLLTPVLPMTDVELTLFGEDLAADMRDVTFTPDFPRGAAIAREIWQQQVGGEVDGVVSVDPGALALMLGATGPVPLPAGPVADASGGMLTADNAVDVLLSTVYLTLSGDPAAQDAVFAQTASTVFDALLAGQGDSVAGVDALAEAARQGRLMVWSADAAEQSLLEGTVLSGELRGEVGDSPVIGVFFNDGSQAKMDYYLSSSVAVEQLECRADGSRSVSVTITLTNTAAADAATTLPAYVTGGGTVVPAGEVRTNVLVYAPTGGTVEDVQVVGEEPGVTSHIHNDLVVVGRTTQLAPGASTKINAVVTTGSADTGPVVLRTTPLANGNNLVTEASQCS